MTVSRDKTNKAGYFLRVLFLIILLACVAAVIFVAMRGMSKSEPAPGPPVGEVSLSPGKAPTLFEQFVTSGGWIVWFILLPMSFAMVYLSGFYAMTIRKSNLAPAGIGNEIGRILLAAGPKELVNNLGEKNDLVSIAIAEAFKKGRDDWFRLREAFFESMQEQALRLSRQVEWINLIGNVSPMVGLFGTVVGMIELFGAIVTAGGQPQPIQLAHGISVALVTTFWGLLIAIPALSVYGIFRNRIEALVNEAISEGEDALRKIRSGLESRRRLETAKPKQESSSADKIIVINPKQSAPAQQQKPVNYGK
ncbi:MAG: MotA/TolQ/ExbB proton channel family protein [Sedimentisphaerales bacterium]|nr:MotA/TolQ/ExbB proton channel family protein [Sedimentisphaerales bacterium]